MAVSVSTPDGGALLRAKALSAPSRVDILDRLQRAATPLTAADLSAAMSMHHTAVREHLALLVDAGLVRGVPLPVIGRGRPRTGYVAIEHVDPAAAYRELATMLTEAVRNGLTAREAGRVAGGQVEAAPGDAVEALRDEAERLGFRPQVRVKGDTRELVLKQCPFHDLATERPETVCDLHLGFAEGVCEMVGGAVVEGLKLADPRKGGCRIMLRAVPVTVAST